MGGSAPSVVQPTPPPQPTAGQSMAEYVQNLPALYGAQMEYMPQFAQLAKTITEQLYPETAGLQDQLATQASEGMGAGLPDWAREQYRSDVSAQLGTNVGSPVGADYASTGLLQLQEDWKRHYQNLALTTTGQQQLVQAPSYQTMQGGFTPGSVMNMQQGTYGTYAQAGRPMILPGQQSPWASMLGKGVGGLMGGIGYGMMS